MTNGNNNRADYIAGLSLLGQLLADEQELNLPMWGSRIPLAMYVSGETALTTALAVMRMMTSRPVMEVDRDNYLNIVGRLLGLAVKVFIPVGDICTATVTGVHRASDGSVHEITEWTIPAELLNAKAPGAEPEPGNGNG
ncbi:hypothetical protein ACWDA3_25905 [Nonomuraea rubra]